MPNFIFLCGPQAVGKMTVGQELAKLTGYKLFYNHMTIEWTRFIFDYDKEIFWNVNANIRNEVFKEFAKSNQKGIICTGCFDFGPEIELCKNDIKTWTENYDNVYVVELEADLEERLKRNKTENRLKHKESKRDLEWSEKELIASVKKHKFNSDPGQGNELFENYLKINNTSISAVDTAKLIQKEWKL